MHRVIEMLLTLYFILTETFTCGTGKHKEPLMQGIQFLQVCVQGETKG